MLKNQPLSVCVNFLKAIILGWSKLLKRTPCPFNLSMTDLHAWPFFAFFTAHGEIAIPHGFLLLYLEAWTKGGFHFSLSVCVIVPLGSWILIGTHKEPYVVNFLNYLFHWLEDNIWDSNSEVSRWTCTCVCLGKRKLWKRKKKGK